MRRSAQGHLGREAHRRRVATLHFLRQLARAELHRDRVRSRIEDITRQVALDRAAGIDMSSSEDRLIELRADLAIAEADLTAARVDAGLSHAA